jgi:hypothetical protein
MKSNEEVKMPYIIYLKLNQEFFFLIFLSFCFAPLHLINVAVCVVSVYSGATLYIKLVTHYKYKATPTVITH